MWHSCYLCSMKHISWNQGSVKCMWKIFISPTETVQTLFQSYYKRYLSSTSLALKNPTTVPSFWEGGWKSALLILVFPDNLLLEIQEQSRSCTEGQFPPSTKAATQRSAEGHSGRQTLKARDNILIFDSCVQLYWQVYAILNSTTLSQDSLRGGIQAYTFY